MGQDIEELDDEAATALAGLRWQAREAARRQSQELAAAAAARAEVPATEATGPGLQGAAPTPATTVDATSAPMAAGTATEAAGQGVTTALLSTTTPTAREGHAVAAAMTVPAPAPPPWQPPPQLPVAAVEATPPRRTNPGTAGQEPMAEVAPCTPSSDGESSSTSTSSGLSGSTVTAEQMEEIKRRPANWRSTAMLGVVSDPTAYAGDRKPLPPATPATPRRARRSPSTEDGVRSSQVPAPLAKGDTHVEWVPVVDGMEPIEAGAAAATMAEGPAEVAEVATAEAHGAVTAQPEAAAGLPSPPAGMELAAPLTPQLTETAIYPKSAEVSTGAVAAGAAASAE